MSVLFFVAISLVFFYGSVRYAIYLAAAAVFNSLLFSSLISFLKFLLCCCFSLIYVRISLESDGFFALSLSLTLCIHCLMSNYYIVCPYSQALCEWLRSHAMLPPLFCLMHSRFFRVANFFIRFEVKFTDIPHLVDQRRIYFSELGIPVFF